MLIKGLQFSLEAMTKYITISIFNKMFSKEIFNLFLKN